MKLALQAADDFPTHLEQVQVQDARRVRELGFQAIGAFFGLEGEGRKPQDPRELTTEKCRRVRTLLTDEGVEIAHFWAMWAPLMHPDEPTRQEAVRTLQESCRVASDLGTHVITLGSGSASTVHGWAPHRDNFRPESVGRLIKSLTEGLKAAADYDVMLSLKGHVLTTVNTPERASEVAEAIDSPHLRCGVDPVNWMTLEHAFDVGAWTKHIFEILKGRIGVLHAKDVILEDQLVLHLTERAPGEGIMDYPAYLQLGYATDPDAWVILEHVPLAKVSEARAHLLASAAKVNASLS